MSSPITIDGSQGEGGGQILRTALALSLATGTPVRVENIRAGRRKPGLLRQHLTCVGLATEIGDAEVEGAEMGSPMLRFEPRGCHAGSYHAQVGTAGSTSLVAQSVLPALMVADGPSELVIEGGTHARSAPPFEFLRDSWSPLMAHAGGHIAVELARPGFFPKGGGRLELRAEPAADPQPLELLERGAHRANEATALVARLPRHIAERELAVVGKRLGWSGEDLHIEEREDSVGPGNALLLKVAHEHVTEVFAAFGAVGVPAERVARHACNQARDWMRSDVPVGEHLADQLMLPLALGAGGVYRTSRLTQHSRTNRDVIHAFLGEVIDVQELAGDTVAVHVTGRERASRGP